MKHFLNIDIMNRKVWLHQAQLTNHQLTITNLFSDTATSYVV